jgi:hypothetical protein
MGLGLGLGLGFRGFSLKKHYEPSFLFFAAFEIRQEVIQRWKNFPIYFVFFIAADQNFVLRSCHLV